MEELNWHNCYSNNLKGIICDEAFCHPAKFSYGLIARIYSHLLERGWLQEGDLVADPFAGVGIGGIVAAANGLRWIGVELEEKFCKLAEDSFSLHKEQWEKMGKPYPVILQGDSRDFNKLIGEEVQSIVCSPPYSEDRRRRWACPKYWASSEEWQHEAFYGTTNGQIGAMKEGNLEEVVDAILTSPPYVDRCANDSQRTMARTNLIIQMNEGDGQTYGHSEGQLGAMPEGDHAEVVEAIITSPPYAGMDVAHIKRTMGEAHKEMGTVGHRCQDDGYSDNPTNMGNLPEGSHEEVVSGIVTSPPWEKTSHERTFDSDEELEAFAKQQWVYREGGRSLEATKAFLRKDWQGYSEAEGQIGQEESETYWASVAQVYRECFKALKPNGCLVVVVKAFVRNKQIVDLPSQTLELLQAIGFEPLGKRIKAWMVSPATQKSLMPEIKEDYQKSHKSFFRRLAESKGSPHVDFEEVLIVQKLGRRSND